MDNQDIIAVVGVLLSFFIWLKISRLSKNIAFSIILLMALQIGSHIAYPDRYQDAMWVFGAGISLLFQCLGIAAGGALGYVVRVTSKRK